MISSGESCLAKAEYTASGSVWMMKNHDTNDLALYRQTYTISLLEAMTLLSRDISTELIPDFLNTSLRDLLSTDLILPDIDIACTILSSAIREKKKIALFGDYDVDGMSSCAMMLSFLHSKCVDPSVWIPSRDDGYGLSQKGIDTFIQSGVQLMIIFDCGSNDISLIEFAKKHMQVIVVDHHKISSECAQPDAFINPYRPVVDYDTFEHVRGLCASGLCFLFIAAFLQKQQERLDFSMNYDMSSTIYCSIDTYDQACLYTSSEIDALISEIKPYSVYAALGTVCDVMSLKHVINRVIVKTGLIEMSSKTHIGISVLMDFLKIPQKITAQHLGFTIGPRLNAGSRMHKEELSFSLLTTKSRMEAVELTNKLENLNNQRKQLEEYFTKLACEQADQQNHRKVLFITGQDWHIGVIGIVSSVIKEMYNKPVVVISYIKDEDSVIGKGSARSIPGIDIGQLIQRAVSKGLLVTGGGHALAAGLSVLESKIQELMVFFEIELLSKKTTQQSVHNVDAIVSLDTIVNLRDLYALSPFGCDFPSPKVLVSNVKINNLQVYKTHTLVSVSQNGVNASFFAFRTNHSKLGRALTKCSGRHVDLLLNVNENGQANIADLCCDASL